MFFNQQIDAGKACNTQNLSSSIHGQIQQLKFAEALFKYFVHKLLGFKKTILYITFMQSTQNFIHMSI